MKLALLTVETGRLRLRGYKLLLAGQILMMVNFLVSYEFFSKHPFPFWWEVILLGTVSVMALMNVLAYYLIKELTSSRWMLVLVTVLLFAGVVFTVPVGLGWIRAGSGFAQFTSAVAVFFSIVAFVVLLSFMLVDVFREKHEVAYRLWGCASIYIMFGTVFGLIYTFVDVLMPLEFAIQGFPGIFKSIPCYNLSFYTLAGIDYPFEGVGILVRNLTVIESIFSNLFIVLVVGRLLAK